MRIGSLFSGYGGLDMGVQAAWPDAELAWVSDIAPGAVKLLAHRHPDVPNLGDITAVDWSQVEPVEIITGGFPCQDLSTAGARAGMRTGTRSGLWSEMHRAISTLRLTGRPAPSPTEPGKEGKPRLSARFVEWMMCLPKGWVTDTPGLSRSEQLALLGNGVVPIQSAAALTHLLSIAGLEAAV